MRESKRKVTLLFTDWDACVCVCVCVCVQGTLKGFDQTINLILDESHERVFSSSQGVEQVVLGLYIVRGDNVWVTFDLWPVDNHQTRCTVDPSCQLLNQFRHEELGNRLFRGKFPDFCTAAKVLIPHCKNTLLSEWQYVFIIMKMYFKYSL